MFFHYNISEYIEFSISDEVVYIHNSYKVKTIPEMEYIIMTLRIKYPSCKVLKRSNNSLINEWRTYNLFYTLGLFEDHVKDVCLSAKPWYINIMCTLLSPLYLHF